MRAWIGLILVACAGGGDDSGATDADGDGVTVAEGDCDDGDPSVFPGAIERCSGIDEDCDGLGDEEGLATWFPMGGEPEDVAAALDGEGLTLRGDGTLRICAGTWSGPLVVDGDAIVTGVGEPWPVLDGEQTRRPLEVAGGSPYLTRLELRDGSAEVGGCARLAGGTLAVGRLIGCAGVTGGGVAVEGDAILEDLVIERSTAVDGGAACPKAKKRIGWLTR